MASPQLFAALAAGQAIGGISEAYRNSVFAGLQAEQIQAQLKEMERRSDYRSDQIKQQGQRAAAEQASAFIKAGVDLSVGTPMAVMARTLSNAAESASIQERQTRFDMVGLQLQQAGLERQASSEAVLLNSLGSVLGAGAGYMQNTRNTTIEQNSRGK